MKNVFVKFLYLLLIFAATQSLAFAANKNNEILLDRIVAVVNENVILASELENKFETAKRRLKGKVELPTDEIIKKQVLEQMIVERLQLDEADRYGITIDDTTLNNELRALASRNGLSLEGLRQKLLEDGMDYETFRKQRKKDLILNNLRRGYIRNQIKISEAEINDFLAAQNAANNKSEYLVSHIQFSMPEDADNETQQETKAKANSVYDRLQQGEDFAKLAIAESDGRKALEGGALGWFRLSELPKQFATELQNLNEGQISKPFKMPNGYHILKLEKTKGIKRIIVKQIKVRHILLKADKLNTDEKVREQLLDFRKQILDGEDFGKLAKMHSKDPGSASNNGVLNWTESKIYVPQFKKVIETLPVGKISQPFRSQFGWHIVEVLGWRDFDKTVDVARNTAYAKLFERKAMIEEELWIRRLRSEAFVDIRM
jgi:peptidyl-prolyl cis-trans isomerase SurA